MLKKLILPIAAIALLGGCMTGGYSYQRDRGDYYYGQPTTDYRYYGNDGYYDQRYRGYYPSYYGSAYYGSGYRYNRYNRYPYGYYRPPVIVVRPGHDNNNDHNPRPDNDRDRAPWRDYERLQRERIQRSERPTGTPAAVQRSAISAPVRATASPVRPAVTRPAPRSSDSRGSRMQNMIRKSKSGGNGSDRIEER